MSFPIEDIASAKTKIEEDLKLVAAWFFENKLLINPEKTKLLLIETRQLLGKLLEETTITFLGEEITPTTNAKDLGLTLDSYLTYDYHIKKVVSSCMAKLCQINRVKDIYLFIYLLCFASKHHTIIALKKLGHHNSLTPITVGPLQNININIENRNN